MGRRDSIRGGDAAPRAGLERRAAHVVAGERERSDPLEPPLDVLEEAEVVRPVRAETGLEETCQEPLAPRLVDRHVARQELLGLAEQLLGLERSGRDVRAGRPAAERVADDVAVLEAVRSRV